jgi:peptide/nickel transport system ATP-binding protein
MAAAAPRDAMLVQVPIGEEGAAPLPAPGIRPEETDTSALNRGDVILDIRNLKTYFYTYDGVVLALDGVSFKLRRGETLGLAGETGCGKSVTAFSVLRLIPDPPGRIVSGKILFRGADLLWGLDKEARIKPIKRSARVKVIRKFRRIKAASARMMAVRGHGISMIFQEPSQAMNPIFPVYDQIGETLVIHRGKEIMDELLQATPNALEVRPAIERLAEAVRARESTERLEELANVVGEAAHLSSFGTQAFYSARNALSTSPTAVTADLEAGLRRFRLSGLQRSYIQYRRRQTEILEELRQTYMREMQEGQLHRLLEARARRRTISLRWSHPQFAVPFVHRRAEKPLKDELFWRTVGLLEGVEIANPVQVARCYPFELSGGMIQRVMIAMALSSEPAVLIADEPTTALDVTIQAQILDLMRDLKTRVGTSTLLITHDLAVLAEVADRICIMYAGNIVENAPVRSLFANPLHPYTRGLLASIPRVDQPDKRLESIPGSVPNLITPPTGCRFHPRCPYAMPVCKETRPPMTDEGNGHSVACFLYHGPSVVE